MVKESLFSSWLWMMQPYWMITAKANTQRKSAFCRIKDAKIMRRPNQDVLILVSLLAVMYLCHKRDSALCLFQATGHQMIHLMRQDNGVGLKLNVRKDRSKNNPIKGSSGWISIRAHTSDENSREMAKRHRLSENLSCDLITGGDDPFAFDDVDQQPTNWDLIDPKKKPQQK
jgi:hypothetical protein